MSQDPRIKDAAAAFRRSIGLCIRQLREVQAKGELGSPEASVLKRLDRSGTTSVTELTKVKRISVQSMETTLGALKSRGLVERAADDSRTFSSAIGFDLVEVASLRYLLETCGSSFVNAGWTDAECEETCGRPESLAGKWAAKEAVMKVLRRGIVDLDPKDIEIIKDPSGAPRVKLHRSARLAASVEGFTVWSVSVTHQGGWAVAIALGSSEHRLVGTTVDETADHA